jgi:hypothetical protein
MGAASRPMSMGGFSSAAARSLSACRLSGYGVTISQQKEGAPEICEAAPSIPKGWRQVRQHAPESGPWRLPGHGERNRAGAEFSTGAAWQRFS